MKKAALIACATLGLGASAMAGDAVITASKTVKYSRVEASTPAGAVKLYGALRIAAVRACRDVGEPSSVFGDSMAVCTNDALSRAIADVQIDAVTALYLQDAQAKAKGSAITVASR